MDVVSRKWNFLWGLCKSPDTDSGIDLQHLPATQDYAQETFGWKKYGAMLRFCSVPEYILSGSCTEMQLLSFPPCTRISAVPSGTEQRTAETVLLIKHIFLFKPIFIILFLDEPINKGRL